VGREGVGAWGRGTGIEIPAKGLRATKSASADWDDYQVVGCADSVYVLRSTLYESERAGASCPGALFWLGMGMWD
jgi:hypothetical protein